MSWRRVVFFAFFLVISGPPTYAQAYEDEMSLGISAYQNGLIAEAAEHFRNAVALDESAIAARMYLATTYASQYIPGVVTPENRWIADKAIEFYRDVINANADDTQKINAAKGVAYIYLNLRQFEEAKENYMLASDLDPKDPEPYFSIGIMDWMISYGPRVGARTKLQMSPDEQLNAKDPEQKSVCDELRAKSASAIDEGIESLKNAIELRPDYDDAMAYLNLMYREKADLECDDPKLRAKDLQTADEWVDMALATKMRKAEALGVVLQNPDDSSVPGSKEPNPQ